MIETKGLKEAQRALIDLKRAVGQGRREPMVKVCKESVDIIKKRTAKGIDVDHQPFMPYSKAYAKKKKKKGGGRVNLKLSGDMLDGISWQAWAKKGRIYIKSGLTWILGKTHNVGGRSGEGTGFAMPKREFMGVTKEADKLRKMYREWWENFAKGLGF